MTRGGGLPSPAAAVIPVKRTVSTAPSGAGGGAAHATPSLPSPAAAVIAVAIIDVNAGGRECESIQDNQGESERPRARGATLVDEGHAVVIGIGARALHPSSWLSLWPPGGERGGGARGRGGRHSSTRDTLSSLALAAGRSIHRHGCRCGRRHQRRP